MESTRHLCTPHAREYSKKEFRLRNEPMTGDTSSARDEKMVEDNVMVVNPTHWLIRKMMGDGERESGVSGENLPRSAGRAASYSFFSLSLSLSRDLRPPLILAMSVFVQKKEKKRKKKISGLRRVWRAWRGRWLNGKGGKWWTDKGQGEGKRRIYYIYGWSVPGLLSIDGRQPEIQSVTSTSSFSWYFVFYVIYKYRLELRVLAVKY